MKKTVLIVSFAILATFGVLAFRKAGTAAQSNTTGRTIVMQQTIEAPGKDPVLISTQTRTMHGGSTVVVKEMVGQKDKSILYSQNGQIYSNVLGSKEALHVGQDYTPSYAQILRREYNLEHHPNFKSIVMIGNTKTYLLEYDLPEGRKQRMYWTPDLGPIAEEKDLGGGQLQRINIIADVPGANVNVFDLIPKNPVVKEMPNK